MVFSVRFHLDTPSVDFVIRVSFNVTVCYDNEPPALAYDFLVHSIDLLECFIVELEVLVVVRVINVHPQHVDWKVVLAECHITFDHLIGCDYTTPLAEMETQSVRWGHLLVAYKLSQRLGDMTRALFSREYEKL